MQVVEQCVVGTDVAAADVWVVAEAFDLLILNRRDEHFLKELVGASSQQIAVVDVVERSKNRV